MRENQIWWAWLTGLILWTTVAPLLGMFLGLGAPHLGEKFIYSLCLAIGAVGMALFIFGEAWEYRHRDRYDYRSCM